MTITGTMRANIIWNATHTTAGMVGAAARQPKSGILAIINASVCVCVCVVEQRDASG